jgi:hypothetical protein
MRRSTMPERWERELQTLRRAEPRVDLWRRVEEGPHGSPSAPPSGRKRLVAGGVAFAVFIAAGLFAWNAFQPTVQEGLPPAGSPQAIMAFRALVPQPPELTVTVDGATYAARLGRHSFSVPGGGSGTFGSAPPIFFEADAIPIVRGTPLLIDNAPPTLAISAYEGLVTAGPKIDLSEPGAAFDLPVGIHLIVVDAQWDDAAAQFWLPINVSDEIAPTPSGTTELDRYGVLVTYPPGWAPASESLTPNLADPQEVLALGTYPLMPGGSHCAQFPERAIEDLGPTDALIWLADRPLVHDDTAERPPDLGVWLRAQPSDVSSDCLSEPKDFVHHSGGFRDANREFEIYVAYGAEASSETIEELWAIVDGMRVMSPEGLQMRR